MARRGALLPGVVAVVVAAVVALGGVLAHEGVTGGDVLRAMPPLTVPDRAPVPSGDVYLAARGREDPNDPVVAVRRRRRSSP